MKKIVLLILFSLTFSALAEQVAHFRNESTQLPDQFKNSYEKYWNQVKLKQFDKISMDPGYLDYAKYDLSLLSHYVGDKSFKVRPVFFKELKNNLYMISADLVSESDDVLFKQMGCHLVKKTDDKIVFFSYTGECLDESH